VDANKFFRMGNGEFGQDDRIEQLKYGEVGSDGEGERENRGCREDGSAEKLARGMTEIMRDSARPWGSLLRNSFLVLWGVNHPDGSHATESAAACPHRRGVRAEQTSSSEMSQAALRPDEERQGKEGAAGAMTLVSAETFSVNSFRR